MLVIRTAPLLCSLPAGILRIFASFASTRQAVMNVVGSEHARSHHDVGGSVCSGEGEGPLELGDRELDLWEKRVDFVQCALASKGLTTVDRLRHAIEKLEPDTYKDFSYYGGRGYPSPVLYLNPGVPKHHTWVSGILHDWNLMFGSAPMEPFQGGRHIRFGPVTDARGGSNEQPLCPIRLSLPEKRFTWLNPGLFTQASGQQGPSPTSWMTT